jgi:5'-deoxynucleotidase YfbR-like HD superfamily hydrolase
VKHAWTETFSGRKFEILNPKQESVTIEDIAHALSQVCRFGGHTKYFYSVAQHSYLGSFLVPEKDSLWFLLHDASEAYIGDMTTPMKHLTKAGEAYLPIEKRIMQVVCQKFNLAETQPPSVHAADVAMLHAEKEQLMGSVPWDRKWGKLIKPADVKIKELTPRKIEKLFLKRFRELQTAQTKGESNGRN